MHRKRSIFLMFSLTFGLIACEKDQSERQEQAQQSAAQQEPPQQPVAEPSNVEKVSDNPEDQYGKTMTFEGEVDKVLNDRAFVLEEENALWGDRVLVLLKQQPEQALREDMHAKVTGEVQKFVTVEVEKDIGWDLDREIETEYEEKPVVVAKSFALLTESD